MSFISIWVRALIVGGWPIGVGLLCLLRPNWIRQIYSKGKENFPIFSRLGLYPSDDSTFLIVNIIVGGAIGIAFGIFIIYMMVSMG
jgi:hypothetical protein